MAKHTVGEHNQDITSLKSFFYHFLPYFTNFTGKKSGFFTAKIFYRQIYITKFRPLFASSVSEGLPVSHDPGPIQSHCVQSYQAYQVSTLK